MVMLYDYAGRPVKTGELKQELAAPGLTGVRSVWGDVAAAGLTPVRLAGLLQNAADGDIRQYLTLAEEMEERDLHYRCEIGKRKLAVSGLPVTVESASDDKRDVELTDAVRELTRRPGFRGLLKDLLDGLGKGFSVCEIIWQRGQKWLPERYVWRDPKFFVFDRATGQKLRLLDEADSYEGIELAPYKFIVHLPHLKTGLPIRGGIARVAAWAWMCKNFTVKDWMAFAEVYGMPLRLGKYQPGADSRDIAILKSAVANLGSDAAAVIPESMLIEFVETAKSGGGQELYLKLADWLDTQVSRGILGQAATTQGTPGKLGNDQAQAEVRDDIRDDDALQLAETINRDLVRPYIDLNFGPQEQYPQVVIRAVEQEDLTLLADALAKLVPLGLKVEQSEIRDKFGLSEPAEDAEILSNTALMEQGQGMSGDGQDDVRRASPDSKKASGDDQKASNQVRAINIAQAAVTIPEALFAATRERVALPVINIVEAAEQLLNEVDSLEEFRERLIELFVESDPEGLAEVLAQTELLANLAGRVEVQDESGRI